jgi:hypothetical protein
MAHREDWGQLGPAMKALPNDKWRAFVEFYILDPGRGAQARAARRAGFGKVNAKPINMANTASRLMRDERMIAAISEEARKLVRAGAPEAARALLGMVRNPDHKDHARAVAMLLDRVDPVTSYQHVEVIHKHVDADQEAVEELRALRQLGTPREKLIELFGHNGLERIEALEAADAARRARDAKVIDGEAVELMQEEATDGNS